MCALVFRPEVLFDSVISDARKVLQFDEKDTFFIYFFTFGTDSKHNGCCFISTAN